MSVMYLESNSIFYFVNTMWPYFFPLPFKPAPSLHLCVCTPHSHTKRCTKLVNDACAGRSSWQMLHSGSLGVTHGTHILITCCGSLNTQSEEWQSSRLPHVCLFPLAPTCSPASPLPFSSPLLLASLVLPAHFTRGSWLGFYGLLLFSFTVFIKAQHKKTPPEIFNVCLKDVGQAQVCTHKFIFWLSPCENVVCVRMEA